jgi:DNA repair photolyase
MPVKQILNRCTSPRMPFRWTINPYRGCEFGCVYCYARYTHEFLELRDPMDFERRIFVKLKAAEALARTLSRTPIGSDQTPSVRRRIRISRLSENSGLRAHCWTSSPGWAGSTFQSPPSPH